MRILRLALASCLIGLIAVACNGPEVREVTRVVVVTEEPSQAQAPADPATPHQARSAYALCSKESPGAYVTCQITRAYCDFRPDINGEPTFCNDAPYPGHSFTLLVWGQDWSDLYGKCLLVTGEITRYRGLPQIVATSRSQVQFCP